MIQTVRLPHRLRQRQSFSVGMREDAVRSWGRGSFDCNDVATPCCKENQQTVVPRSYTRAEDPRCKSHRVTQADSGVLSMINCSSARRSLPDSRGLGRCIASESNVERLCGSEHNLAVSSRWPVSCFLGHMPNTQHAPASIPRAMGIARSGHASEHLGHAWYRFCRE